MVFTNTGESPGGVVLRAMVNPPEGVVFEVVESFCISFGIQGCRVVRKACL